MDEPEKACYFRDPEARRHHRRSTFSIAALFRAATLAGMFFGWTTLVATASPQTNFLAVILMSALLSVIVGNRRYGKPWRRGRAALLFFAGGIFIAVYSCCLARFIQRPVEIGNRWAGLDVIFGGIAFLPAFPILLAVSLCLLRSWVWSANERSVHKQ